MSKIKNPLNKRLPRELKKDAGKYIVIFLFMTMLISLVSGFLVADNSIQTAYDEGFTKYNLEFGHVTFNQEVEEDLLEELERENNIHICDLRYFEEAPKDNKKIRVYKNRTDMNLACVMKGSLPANDNEIALDRVYAKNNDLSVGDTICLNGKTLTISALISVPDYSGLFEKNTDMMFDSVNFSIALMTEEGYDSIHSKNQFYNYAFQYNDVAVDMDDDVKEKKLSDKLMENAKDTIIAYDEEYVDNILTTRATALQEELLAGNTISEDDMAFLEALTQEDFNPFDYINEADILTITDYVPRYHNQAINFAGNDMGNDKAMFKIFNYIVIVILAFVFAVTISATISAEAGVIGTLRASGFSRGELIRHYMVLPVTVTLIAAVIGNIIGYSIMKDYMAQLYYNSYSLCSYETLWNLDAFVDTTVIPIIIMFLINLFTLISKLKLSPLKFLRRDLSKKQKKKAFRLNTKIPFIQRFRIRILFQNMSNYVTLFFGILCASVVVIFGFMFTPLFEDYAESIVDTMICKYEYIVLDNAKTENEQAEPFCMTELKTTDSRFLIDDVSIFGIAENSAYITKAIPKGQVLVTDSILKKFGLKMGDTISLKDPYGDDDGLYDFVIGGSYVYDAGLAIFMPREEYLTTFNKGNDYITGYFSNEELADLDENLIVTTISEEELTKTSRQLLVSMGSFMGLMTYFGAAMFLLLMYLLSKQIIEKNAQSISMTKILGFYNGEIGGLYIVATSIVVVLSLLVSAPLTKSVLKVAFEKFLYTAVSGFIPFNISSGCFIKTIVLGIVCYAVVAALQLVKISKIPKSDALKNVE